MILTKNLCGVCTNAVLVGDFIVIDPEKYATERSSDFHTSLNVIDPEVPNAPDNAESNELTANDDV